MGKQFTSHKSFISNSVTEGSQKESAITNEYGRKDSSTKEPALIWLISLSLYYSKHAF